MKIARAEKLQSIYEKLKLYTKEQIDEVLLKLSEERQKEEYVKILKMLRTLSFSQMMSVLSLKDAIVISLKFGYVDEKYFSTKSISEFLEIEKIRNYF